jgi:hypothetical protein
MKQASATTCAEVVGRSLTEQEEHLSLEQVRSLGVA